MTIVRTSNEKFFFNELIVDRIVYYRSESLRQDPVSQTWERTSLEWRFHVYEVGYKFVKDFSSLEREFQLLNLLCQ